MATELEDTKCLMFCFDRMLAVSNAALKSFTKVVKSLLKTLKGEPYKRSTVQKSELYFL